MDNEQIQKLKKSATEELRLGIKRYLLIEPAQVISLINRIERITEECELIAHAAPNENGAKLARSIASDLIKKWGFQ